MICHAIVLRERNGRFTLDVEIDRKRVRKYYSAVGADHELLLEHIGERVSVAIDHGQITRIAV